MVTFTTLRRRGFFAFFILSVFATLFFTASMAQKGSGGNPAADLDQIRNGSQTSPLNPAQWVNGNAGASNAHYVESHSIAYRARLSSLPKVIGTEVKLVLGYDIRHSSRNAIDYLTHYNRLLPHDQFPHTTPELIDPTAGTTFSGAAHDEHLIEKPNALVNPIAAGSWQKLYDADAEQLEMSAWGADITSVKIIEQGNLSLAQSEARVEVTFLLTTTSGNALLAWGGHIAARKEWGYDGNGVPNSAGGISGSPYHMRTLSWNLSNLGNQDRSLSAAAVIFCEVDGGDVAGSGTICTGGNVAAFTVTTAATGNGTLSFQWQISTTGQNDADFSDITGATSATFDPDAAGALNPGTYYYRRVTKSDGELDCQDASNILTVNVNDVDAGVIGNSQTICSGGNPAAITFTTTGAPSGSGSLSYQWQISTTGTANDDFSNITGANSNTYDPAALAATTHYRVVVTSTVGGVPCAEASDPVTVTVNDVDAGVIGNSQSECDYDGFDPLTFTTTGAPSGSGSLSYRWQISTTGTANDDFSNINGATGTSFDPDGAGALDPGTYYYRVVVTSTQNQVACAEASAPVTITVNGQPDPPTLVVHEGTLCGTQSSASVEVCGPSAGTYTFTQGSRTEEFDYPEDGNTVLFTGLTNGVAFTVTYETPDGCVSDPADCDEVVASCGATTRKATNTEEVVKKTERIHDINARIGGATKVLAAPNPFTDKVRFTLQSEVSGQGSLEIFNTVGQKVATLYQGHVEAGRVLNKEYLVPVSQRQNLIYIFKVGDQKTTGKLLNW